jgi:hypothetical protein
MPKIGVDPACVDLAKHFLVGARTEKKLSEFEIEQNVLGLSQTIQIAVEDWFLDHPEYD